MIGLPNCYALRHDVLVMVVQRVDRAQFPQTGLFRFRQSRVRGAHVGDTGAATLGRDFDAI
jgi:hypothetical protein